MNYNICLIGTKDTTMEWAKYLIDNVCMIDCIITIDEQTVDTSNISGFSPIDEFATKYNISIFKSKSYSLKDEESKQFFENNTFGIGICMGWQRLIPPEVLKIFRSGIFGFHGSCGYLPYGRGRSPLNWSIINGDTRFIMNLFKYDEYADSPNIYQNRMFEINPFDTIRTLQYKNLLVSFDLVKNLIYDYKNNNIKINKNSNDFDTVYNKRGPDDGKISFLLKTREIYNLIRGVTKPFPGAFAFLNNSEEKIIIWKATMFDSIIDLSGYKPGEVVEVFDNMPIIRTIDGSIIINDYESKKKLTKKDVLH